jgi:uncharacterized protein
MENYHLLNRPDRELKSESEINAVLEKGKFVVISMCRNNEPYIVTLSYGFDVKRNALYFHCAPKGLKLEFLNSNSKVCATVIEDGGYIEDECAHEYKTVVFWGNMHVVNELNEKKHGMDILLRHLEKQDSVINELKFKLEDRYLKMNVLRLDIGQIHGKAGR